MSAKQFCHFFNHRPTTEIAKSLLGKRLVYQSPQGRISGYIVEVEAYLGEEDSAAHAYKGRRTPSNEALYGPPGTIYIYSMHGRYMLNTITQDAGKPQGILIRAIEPEIGIKIMEKNRQKHGFDLTNGPGKLMEALGIGDKTLNLTHMSDAPLFVDLSPGKSPTAIGVSVRIGVSQIGSGYKAPYRFFVMGNPYVSAMRKRDMNLSTYGWRDE
ncbi:DNA-3-methyladenine glycosylase [Bacillaceae bacterium Marseille-Q3522]|nr:DNA-3-methyladenine glycosylase [Bacillaceae bacterium Marseille-Q3522]